MGVAEHVVPHDLEPREALRELGGDDGEDLVAAKQIVPDGGDGLARQVADALDRFAIRKRPWTLRPYHAILRLAFLPIHDPASSIVIQHAQPRLHRSVAPACHGRARLRRRRARPLAWSGIVAARSP